MLDTTPSQVTVPEVHMFIPTIHGVKRLFEDILQAFPDELSPDEHWNAGNLYLTPLSYESYKRAIRSLPHITQVVQEWRRSLVPEVERFLTRAYGEFCEGPWEESEAFPDLKTSDWGDPLQKLYFYHSRIKRRTLWSKIKKEFLEEIILFREHLDLRLCASEANQVALRLGRRGGVRVSFAGYSAPGRYSSWQDTPGTRLLDRGDREIDYEPGWLVDFARFLTKEESCDSNK